MSDLSETTLKLFCVCNCVNRGLRAGYRRQRQVYISERKYSSRMIDSHSGCCGSDLLDWYHCDSRERWGHGASVCVGGRVRVRVCECAWAHVYIIYLCLAPRLLWLCLFCFVLCSL